MSETIPPPPPILPNIRDELREYLVCPERLPIHDYERNQELWPRTPDISSLFHYEGSPLCSTLKVIRDPETGKIVEFTEVPIQSAGATAKNSMSFARAPLPPTEATRGTALNIPFWPAGFSDPILNLPKTDSITDELLTVPPGFDEGINFEADGVTIKTGKNNAEIPVPILKNTSGVVNIMDLVKQEQKFLDLWKMPEKTEEPTLNEPIQESQTLEEEEEVIPKEPPVLKISKTAPPTNLKGTQWAVMLDCTKPVTDFKERIPEMAHTWDFELDTFQKLAILQLEQHNHVFVAAHTSAGKTVVAEYAIALSQKHMTRTIYTSPIKALSNQKYRDFKRTFKDVGLITGDFQINQTASCLIMTTEILRSMLYNGSDVARDLEYVIFDEVHYINDADRGHVWEQVLILLPSHVTVVLLSATVPNTVEFADWLGRTYQKKVYVVSTTKRPIPLYHYLYTGTGGQSKDKRFLVLNPQGWHQQGYKQAIESKEETASHHQSHYKGFTPKQEKTLWNALIDHLSKKELLPVVAFTFSRANCDQSAENLINLDLTTQKEKSLIRMYIEDCVNKSLKEPDRTLPQIVRMREILLQGIGVHHSGILPLIKEVVEMLFQKGLVKLLFATETFAMGVNMPARTVVFNSIRKHDGQNFRNLLPAEYIQMAGRAGRRGLDKEGTVIILCKQKIPDSLELREMMTGKPSQLQSQFRLTYGMVLSLLRVESLSVEGMMSRSFREVDHQKKMDEIRIELADLEKKLSEEYNYVLSDYLQPLIKFYQKARDYLEAKEDCYGEIMSHHKVTKELVPGRVVLVTHKNHINKLGIILTTSPSLKTTYKVLVLTNETKEIKEEKPDMWYKMLSLAKEEIFSPVSVGNHTVLLVNQFDILEIYNKVLKINADLTLKDWEKRQIQRFRDDPPGQSCSVAIQELTKLTMAVTSKGDVQLDSMHFIYDLKMNEHELHNKILSLDTLKEKVHAQVDSIQTPNFEEQFASVFNRKYLEDKREGMKFQLSHASMSLYPDYENRISLLKDLKYVDAQNRVELKGRVACEMGRNELMITELVLRNILTKLKPAEVAALLSALIFQAKTKVELNFSDLPSDLRNGMAQIEEVYQEIQMLENRYRISSEVGCRDEGLNFGLVKVVYEWASEKPFSEIMTLTDVQEGIIVRCIQQLNDTICDVRNAARLIGDPELYSKMEEASTAIKRDIVFAASLYTQKEAAIF